MASATLMAARRICAGASFWSERQKDRAAHDRVDDGQNGHNRLHHLVKVDTRICLNVHLRALETNLVQNLT
jgi:hypothetical protein